MGKTLNDIDDLLQNGDEDTSFEDKEKRNYDLNKRKILTQKITFNSKE